MFAAGGVSLTWGAVYSLLLVCAALIDARTRRIPNWLVLVLAVSGLAYGLVGPAPASGPIASLFGLATGFGCWILFYAAGWLGAGDVKLFAAAGAWLGPFRAVEGAGLAAIVGGLLALTWMLWSYGKKRTGDTLILATATPSILSQGASASGGRRTLPYGVALAAGALAAAWMPRLLVLG